MGIGSPEWCSFFCPRLRQFDTSGWFKRKKLCLLQNHKTARSHFFVYAALLRLLSLSDAASVPLINTFLLLSTVFLSTVFHNSVLSLSVQSFIILSCLCQYSLSQFCLSRYYTSQYYFCIFYHQVIYILSGLPGFSGNCRLMRWKDLIPDQGIFRKI